MTRVVILSAFATPFRSGAEACVEEVSKLLKDRFEITIVTSRMRKDLPKHDRLNGVPVVRVGLGLAIDPWLYPFLAPFAARKLQPDLIHGILETFAGLALYFSKWIVPSAKRLLTLQTTNRSFLKGSIVRSPDRVIAISHALSSIAASFGRKDVPVIPNGIPLSDIEKACAHHLKVPGRIVFVGRLEPMKGVDVLLKALSSTPDPSSGGGGESWHLRIVGDGSQKASLERLAHDLGLTGRVTFAGRIASPKVYDEFASAEIFVGLSRSEGLGNVFLEAQAAGCAVVATDVGGIPEIVEDGKTGLLVPSDDTAAAAAAINRLMTDSGLRDQLSTAGKEHAKGFDWSSIAAQYDVTYRDLTVVKN